MRFQNSHLYQGGMAWPRLQRHAPDIEQFRDGFAFSVFGFGCRVTCYVGSDIDIYKRLL